MGVPYGNHKVCLSVCLSFYLSVCLSVHTLFPDKSSTNWLILNKFYSYIRHHLRKNLIDWDSLGQRSRSFWSNLCIFSITSLLDDKLSKNKPILIRPCTYIRHHSRENPIDYAWLGRRKFQTYRKSYMTFHLEMWPLTLDALNDSQIAFSWIFQKLWEKETWLYYRLIGNHIRPFIWWCDFWPQMHWLTPKLHFYEYLKNYES